MLLAVTSQKVPRPVWNVVANKTEVGLNEVVIYTITGMNLPPSHPFSYTIYEEEYPVITGGNLPVSNTVDGTGILVNGTTTITFRTLNTLYAYPTRRVRIVLHSGATGTMSIPVIGPQIVDKLTFTNILDNYYVKEKKGSSSKERWSRLPSVSNISSPSAIKLNEFNSSGRMDVTVGFLDSVHDREWNERNLPYPYKSLSIWVSVPEIYADAAEYTVDVGITTGSFYDFEHIRGKPYGGEYTHMMSAANRAHTHWVVFKVSRVRADEKTIANPINMSITVNKK